MQSLWLLGFVAAATFVAICAAGDKDTEHNLKHVEKVLKQNEAVNKFFKKLYNPKNTQERLDFHKHVQKEENRGEKARDNNHKGGKPPPDNELQVAANKKKPWKYPWRIEARPNSIKKLPKTKKKEMKRKETKVEKKQKREEVSIKASSSAC